MDRKTAENILWRNFHIEHFYDEQWQTIEKILNGERVLLIARSGYGKSLCYQFPAILFHGMTVIFSPLIALMRDQVKYLNNLGITAKCINCEQTFEENFKIINEAKTGKIKILYIAPERQENSDWINAIREMNLSMIVIDEAHCISVWGHDFRPAFRRIIDLVKYLPKDFPVLATTATATKQVEEDIAKQVGSNLTTLRLKLMRENFRLFVIKVESEDEKLIWIGQNIEKFQGSGIIYTGTRISTELYSKWLNFLNVSAIAYNAGLNAQERIEIENGFMNNRWKCIISTNALGMGVDKPDIRFIIHTQIPQSPIHYYQEIGRAGRDGKPSDIILFYNPKDRNLPESFIESSRPSKDKYECVIDAIKKELLGENDLMKKTNLKRTQIRTIKSDLIEQKIIREISVNDKKKYEYILNAPDLDLKKFEVLRQNKLKDLEEMLKYAETNQSRMKFLCNYLGDETSYIFNNCDNSGLQKIVEVQITPEWNEKIKIFNDNNFPEFQVRLIKSNIIECIASSYYGFSKVGKLIHRCKYENGGDFSDELLDLFLKAFKKKFKNENFDLILFVPPTISGDLVRNFTIKVSQMLRIPFSDRLIKNRNTKEQKIFENKILKAANVKGAYSYSSPNEIFNKNILLIDDIYDSGETIKEIGNYLINFGAKKVSAIFIAKTSGGDSMFKN